MRRPVPARRCGGVLRRLGEEVTEVLDYVSASFKVIRHVRPKLLVPHVAYHHRCTDAVAGRSSAAGQGRGLLAHVLVSKYADHLPLYRQSGIYARHGVQAGSLDPG